MTLQTDNMFLELHEVGLNDVTKRKTNLVQERHKYIYIIKIILSTFTLLDIYMFV